MLKRIALYSQLATKEFAVDKLKINDVEVENCILTNSYIDDFVSDYTLIYILTGGVEAIAQKLISNTSNKVLLVALPNDNSLPASYELNTYYLDNEDVEMIYINNVDARLYQDNFISNALLHDRILSYRIGLIGGISSWLVNSKDIPFAKNFNMDIEYVELDEVLNIYNSTSQEDIEPTLKKWYKAFNTKKVDNDDLINSAKLFYSLYVICKKYGLKAITIKCFDLLEHNVTACLALAELNSIGIIAGCEGDTQALLSLIIAQVITGKTPWMANISDVNPKESMIRLAHCTVPINFLANQKNIELKSHMESGLSLAVCGDVPLGQVTIFRLASNTSQYSILEGFVEDTNMGLDSVCRTQSMIRIENNSGWEKHLVGNHQIVIPGLYKKEIEEFIKQI
jgi:L-fucose isomerase-like protein